MEEPSYEELDSDPQLTEKSLQEKLNAYRKAHEQEFKLAASAEEEVIKATEDFFKKQTPDAAAQIVWLAHNAESETVQANMCKFIIQMGTQDAKRDGDPIKELLADLKKKPVSVSDVSDSATSDS